MRQTRFIMVAAASQRSSQGEFDTRFKHLVQPIRDLIKNWDMNIASELEEYLEEIEHVQISFDGGVTTMNFAEAALLIQGSTCIYSKKVEYLYTLVNKMLDVLASKKKMEQAGSVDAEGADSEATFARSKDTREEFLSLDDIKQDKNIVMSEEKDEEEDEEGEEHSLLQVMPLIMETLADDEKDGDLLFSKQGEVLGYRKDFNMNNSELHPGGTILLDFSHLSLLELSIQTKPHSTPLPARTQELADDQTAEEAVSQPILDDDVGLVPDIPEDDNEPMAFEPADGTVVQGPIDEKQLQQRSKRPAKRPVLAPPVPAHDPLKLVNVEDPCGKARPFKKSRTYRLPPHLGDTSRKRKRDGKDVRPTESVLSYMAKYLHPAFEKQPSKPLNSSKFPEFEVLFWREYKLRRAKERNIRRNMIEQGRLQEVIAEVEEEMQDEHEPAGGAHDEDDDDGGVPQIQGLDLDEADHLPPLFPDEEPAHPCEMGDPTGDLCGGDDAPVVMSYEDLVRNYVEGFLENAKDYARKTDLERRVQEWEEKVLPALQQEDERESFDIHKYGTRILTDLDTNIKSALDSTECVKQNRAPRDMAIPFREIVANKEQFQVCRLFLATLQLANNYNVEIDSVGELEKKMDSMTLKLLSVVRHHEQIQDYQAPSVEDR